MVKIDSLFNFVYEDISNIPDTFFSIPPEVSETFFNILRGVAYFFPVKLCLPIILFSLTLLGIKMSLVIYKFIKSHIPFMN